MANQIAANCGEHRDPAAAAQRTRDHLQRFWTPDMRRQLRQHAESGGDGLSPAVWMSLEDQTNE
ncbi:formate dehydrogenase [Mangrovimicrobium sediminis]|uniref:Formate dehydrogenase n=2 Tax=Mangrovimicrobium sediminis TaxID=2562682 RepID=A0A4Z0M9S5_9GAMM|nr:formate dehydrogenase [Haliea sp. SAOS-164]